MTIYLANCLGFAAILRPVLDAVIVALEAEGYVVLNPFALYDATSCRSVSSQNCKHIRCCDVIVALLDGSGVGVDDGVAYEIGYATAYNIPVVAVYSRDIEVYALNTQLLSSNVIIVKSVEEAIKALKAL